MKINILFIIIILLFVFFCKNFFYNKENYADQVVHATAGNIAGPLVTLPYDMDSVPAYSSISSLERFYPSMHPLSGYHPSMQPLSGYPSSGAVKERYRNFALPFTEEGERRGDVISCNAFERCKYGCPPECPYGCPYGCPYKCPGSSFINDDSPLKLW